MTRTDIELKLFNNLKDLQLEGSATRGNSIPKDPSSLSVREEDVILGFEMKSKP